MKENSVHTLFSFFMGKVMPDKQAYTKKPKNPFHRLIINFLFLLPLLAFLALQAYEYTLAKSLRNQLQTFAPHLNQQIALISYSFFDKSYTLENIQIIEEKLESKLEIDWLKIKNLSPNTINTIDNVGNSKNEALLYSSLQIENIRYFHKNLGIFSLESYYDEDRIVSENFTHFFSTLFSEKTSKADLIHLLSASSIKNMHVEKANFSFFSNKGESNVLLENFTIISKSFAEKHYQDITVNALNIKYKDFAKQEESELKLEKLVCNNFQNIQDLDLTSFLKKENLLQNQNDEQNSDLQQEIEINNLTYQVNEKKIIQFDSLSSSLAIPSIHALKAKFRNFYISQDLYDFYKKSVGIYNYKDEKDLKKVIFQGFSLDIDFDYTLANSLKEATISLSLSNKELFSSTLALNFILPEDVYTILDKPDYFFGILLIQADFIFDDKDFIARYLNSYMQEYNLSIYNAKQKIFSYMPKTQFYTQLQKLFQHKGRLEINLNSGKVLGISDIYGLLLYPHASDFTIKYSEK